MEKHSMSRFHPPRCAAIAAALLTALAAPLNAARAAEGQPSALVRVAPLRQGKLSVDVDAYGHVELAASRSVVVAFPRPVRVLAVDVRVGQRVRRGQPLLRCAGAPGSELAWRQAQAALRQARAALARSQRLAAQQLASQADVDAARRALADARAQRDAARAQQLGTAAQTVRAAFDGVVEAVPVAPGAQLAAGAEALRLAPDSALQAVVGVSPAVAAQLHAGQPASVRAVFESTPAAAARVAQIAGALDARSRLVDVTLELARRRGAADGGAATAWLPGAAVQATFALQPWQGWVVPRQAVLRDAAGQAYVFQDDHGRARRVDVALRRDTADASGISGALDAGLPLVVLGNYELSDGMALRVQR
jgi:RND family efflux transporter MFP subunit